MKLFLFHQNFNFIGNRNDDLEMTKTKKKCTSLKVNEQSWLEKTKATFRGIIDVSVHLPVGANKTCVFYLQIQLSLREYVLMSPNQCGYHMH